MKHKPSLESPICYTVARWLKILQNNIIGGPKKYCFLPKLWTVCPTNEPRSGLERALHFYFMYFKHIYIQHYIIFLGCKRTGNRRTGRRRTQVQGQVEGGLKYEDREKEDRVQKDRKLT